MLGVLIRRHHHCTSDEYPYTNNKYPKYMLVWKIEENYPRIIIKYMYYLPSLIMISIYELSASF